MIFFAVAPLVLLAITIFNFLLIRSPQRVSVLDSSVGVIIPLRNEAENIEGLVATLAAQEAPAHFYLLDDNSQDETLALLERYTAGDARFTVIKGAPLPAGWIGKTWALQQLYTASHEKIVVSIDADVRLENDAINKAVTTLLDSSLDFISPYPRQIALRLGERLIQPLLQWSWLSTVPLRIAERTKVESMAVANGQFFVVKRSSLDAIGGYELIKNRVIDDVFLARLLINSGSKGTVINGADIASCRMYSSWPEIKSGYGKSLSQAFGSVWGAAFVSIFLLASNVAPFILALTGNIYGLIGYGAIVASRILSALKSRGRIADCVGHPIAVIALIYLIVNSYLVRGTVTWKGRTV